jgi:hypothetical protein
VHLLTLNQLHCRPNFTLKPNQITEFSHNQEGMKGLTAARIGPKHTAHFVTHRPTRSIRLDFDEVAPEGTLPTNTSVKRTTARRCEQKLRRFAYRFRYITATSFTPTTDQIKPPIGYSARFRRRLAQVPIWEIRIILFEGCFTGWTAQGTLLASSPNRHSDIG